MADLKRRLQILEEAATGRSLDIPTLADFYAAIGRGEDPSAFGIGKPLSHFYGGRLPARAGQAAIVAPHAGTVN